MEEGRDGRREEREGRREEGRMRSKGLKKRTHSHIQSSRCLPVVKGINNKTEYPASEVSGTSSNVHLRMSSV